MKNFIKKFMLSKIPELICLIAQLGFLAFITFVKPCGFSSFMIGLLAGFIATKIMSRVSYFEKTDKNTSK